MWEVGDRLFRKAHSGGRPGDSLFKCLTAVMILHPDLSDASLPGETRPLVVGSEGRGLKPNWVRKGLNPRSAGCPSGVSTWNTGADWDHHTASRGPIWTTETKPLSPVICLLGGFSRSTVSNILKRNTATISDAPLEDPGLLETPAHTNCYNHSLGAVAGENHLLPQ